MPNVLFISYNGMTDPLGQSQVLPYLVGLSKRGYRFTLLSCEKPDAFAKNKAVIERICADAGIHWEPQPYTKRPPVLSTFWDAERLFRRAAALHRERNFSHIHCRSYISSLVGLRLKKKFGLRFIFDMRGFWADERVDGGLWNLKNPLYRVVYQYFKRKEKQFLTEAAHIISLTHAGRDEIHAWSLPGQPLPIEVIPCCADLDHFSRKNADPTVVAALRERFGFRENDLVLSYLGSVGTWYMLPEMLRFFKKTLEKHLSARMLFVTHDAPAPILEAAAALGLPAERITVAPASRAEVPAFLALSHVGLFFIKPAFSKKASSPTKQGEIMAMGIPLVCNDFVGDTGHVVRKYACGEVLQDFSDASLERAAAGLDDLLRIVPEKIRAGALDFYALGTGVERYASVYARIEKLSKP